MIENKKIDPAEQSFVKTFEKTFEKNFNEIMPGVRYRKTTFEKFKIGYPHLMEAILKTAKDIYNHKL